ncbi:hypothetical protein [Pseudonocardia nigra]|uniref:hypothetical protein n=1 Tax=Pseudonocardia nigra TaxID=1921578 RepID=UPI001C5E2887|nr:hypothetical protein [Pseudonocardia nigra]
MFWTRTGLLLLVLVVVAGSSLAVSTVMPGGTPKNLVVALGTGTLIAAVVGFGQTVITATAAQRAMVTPLIEENRRALQELSAEYRSLNREFFPTHVFQPSDVPDPAFNQLLMQDLQGSRQYFFRGFSARHAAARLLLSRGERELRAVVADPTERSAIGGRARYLIRHDGVDADSETIQAELHDEIYIGLVGLYLARSHCSRIDITMIADPPLDRIEMFDDSVWVTLYSDAGATGSLYPRTLRFSEGSFIYNMERAEFGRIGNSRQARHVLLAPDTSRRDFLLQFENVTGSRLSARQFTELEEKFRRFRHEFCTLAELGS